MRIYKVEPNKYGYEKDIENCLESLQMEVKGYIETAQVTDSIVAIFDEEGRLKDLEDNLVIPHYGVIKGNVIFVRDNGEGDFESLTEQDLEVLKNWY